VINYDHTGDADKDLVHTQALLDFLGEGFNVESNFQADLVTQLDLATEPACADIGPICDEAVAREMVARTWREAAVVIPANFSASIEAGKPVSVTLLYDPAGDAIRREILTAVLHGGAMQLSIQNQVLQGFEQFQDLLEFAPQEVQDSVSEQRDDTSPFAQEPALSVVTVQPTNFRLDARPNTYQQTVPGYTVMFVFFLITYLSGAIQAERNSGTLRRLLHLPVSRSSVLAGKVLAAFVVGLLQVTILFAVGVFLFDMGLGNDPLALLLMTAALVLAAVSMGLAAAAFGLENVLTIPLIIAALVGGCLFPSDWLPPVVGVVGFAVPHTWAMNGYLDILVRGQGLLQVMPSIAVLLGFAVFFFLIAVRRLSFE
jgi:ABC-2 type transport system permease protein